MKNGKRIYKQVIKKKKKEKLSKRYKIQRTKKGNFVLRVKIGIKKIKKGKTKKQWKWKTTKKRGKYKLKDNLI